MNIPVPGASSLTCTQLSLLRMLWVVLAVVTAHAAALWAFNRLKLQRPVQAASTAEILVEVTLSPPLQTAAPRAPIPPSLPQQLAPPVPEVSARPATRPPIGFRLNTQPAPVALAESLVTLSEPVTSAPSLGSDPVDVSQITQSTLSTQPTGMVAAPSTSAHSPLKTQPSTPQPRIELPSTQADYLNNPPPAYPRMSRRLGEQGKVVVRVLIGSDGRAEQAQIHTSSGYERLDQTALTTVLAWRYVPGKRNGVAEAMWFNVPIQFVLE